MIAYCNLALFTMNSAFISTCVNDGSVNVYVYVCIPEDSCQLKCSFFEGGRVYFMALCVAEAIFER
jgi:hypothetical protein